MSHTEGAHFSATLRVALKNTSVALSWQYTVISLLIYEKNRSNTVYINALFFKHYGKVYVNGRKSNVLVHACKHTDKRCGQ